MTGTRTEYVVIATQWARGWELGIQGVGATQSRSLDDAEMMARDLIARRLEVPANSFDVIIKPELGGETLGQSAAKDLANVEKAAARSHGLAAIFADMMARVANAVLLVTHGNSRTRR